MDSIPKYSWDTNEFFDQDPRHLLNLTGKKLTVTTIRNETFEGFLYVTDIVSNSIVVMKNDKEKQDAVIILKDGIKKIEISDTEDNAVFKITQEVSTPEDVQKKKVAVKEWLQKNLINVQEEGENLKILDDIIIESPYGKEQCYSGNTIILNRILDILSKMPQTSL